MWQEDIIEDVICFFKKPDGVKALVLIGSFANEDVKTDEWSDLDFVIIGEDEAINRYMDLPGWLDTFGMIFAIDTMELGSWRVLRACFEDFKRLDFLFIPYSTIEDSSSWHFDPFQEGYKVLFSKIEKLASLIEQIPEGKVDKKEDIENIADDFWFKAMLAVHKVVRNDLLVASHLALDLLRDCLVLKMKLRDLEVGEASIGEESVGTEIKLTPQGILDIIEQSSEEFDALAKQLDNSYKSKSMTLIKWIEKARKDINIDIA